jgi:RNA polymerase sigma factor (sigma-70 family)
MAGMPTTRWSLVLKLAAFDPEVARRAIAALYMIYREPVRLFFERECGDRSKADDLTQALFADLVERGHSFRPDPEHGRFRNYLLAAARHRLQNDARRARVRKEEPLRDEALGSLRAERTPEDEFNAACAKQVLRIALADLESEYEQRGAARVFHVLLPFLLPDGNEPTYETIAVRLGKRAGAVKMDVLRIRRRLGEKVRDIVAVTTADDEVEDELRALASFRQRRGP